MSTFYNPNQVLYNVYDSTNKALEVEIVSGGSFSNTQYTDGGSVPTHPIGTELVFDASGTWQHVSSANPLPVTGGGGGTQYTNGGTPPANPVGNALVYSNGSVWQYVNTTNGLPVQVIGGSGLSVADEATFTAGTSDFTPIGGVFNDSITALTAGQQGAQRYTANRAGHVNLRDHSGNELLGQQLAAASIPVILPAATITTLTPPAALTNYALETGGNLAGIKTDTDKIPSQGQAAMAASMPVAIASNQSAIPVTGTFYQTTQPVSLSSLPSLAAGSATVGNVGLVDNTASTGSITAQDSGVSGSVQSDGQTVLTGTPTANSFVGATISGNSNYSLEVSLNGGGNLPGGTVLVIEKAVSSTQYVPVSVFVTGVNGTQSIISSINSIGVFHGNGAGVTLIRVRCTTYVSGTINIKIQPGVGANLMSVGNPVAEYNYQPATSAATFNASSTTSSALSANCAGMSTALVSVIETGTTTTAGALIFEGYDGTTWLPVQGVQQNTLNPPVSSYTLVNNTNAQFSFDISGYQQFRVRVSTVITGTGTPQAAVTLSLQASDNITSMPVGLAQKLDNVNDSITSYPFGHTYSNITTTTTTTVKSGAGVLHSLTINTPVASSVITIYDNTAGSGTKIGTITLPATLLSEGPQGVILDLAFSTGLTLVTATGASDITVGWR